MDEVNRLVDQASNVRHGFGRLREMADELAASHAPDALHALADALYASEVVRARMLAVLVWEPLAGGDDRLLAFLRQTVSRDEAWQVQEMLARAFDRVCRDRGYEHAPPLIEDWLADPCPNVRRAVTEGLRIWTQRPWFRDHPDVAVRLLAGQRAAASRYLRTSAGNALRDISRTHPALVAAELETWDLSDRDVAFTHRLAVKFLNRA